MVYLFCYQGYKVAIGFFYSTSSVEIFVLVVPASAWLPHVKNLPDRGFKFGNLNQQAGKNAGGLGRNLYQRGIPFKTFLQSPKMMSVLISINFSLVNSWSKDRF